PAQARPHPPVPPPPGKPGQPPRPAASRKPSHQPAHSPPARTLQPPPGDLWSSASGLVNAPTLTEHTMNRYATGQEARRNGVDHDRSPRADIVVHPRAAAATVADVMR